MSDAVTRRTSADIREDIGRTRVGLDFLMDALEGRLSMGSLIDEAMGMLRGRPGSSTEAPIGSLIREHPGPAALITAGVVWLAIENRKDAGKEVKKSRSKSSAAKKSSGRKSSRTKSTGAKRASRSKSTGEE